MGGTKIMVFGAKQVIKGAILAVMGVAALVVILTLVLTKPKAEAPSALYTPGRYSSAVRLNGDPVNVVVSVSGERILSIELVDMSETQEVFYPLVKPVMRQLADDIIRLQSTETVTIPNDSYYTSNLLLQAVRTALSQAATEERQYQTPPTDA
ncbi:hypothetical protein FACS1894188_00040 [Clostridia bacterium]|nr:hypothetical protein FACS1894188_00040 [Clostridia bacterium]